MMTPTQLYDSFEYACLLRMKEMAAELDDKSPYVGLDEEIAKHEAKGTVAMDITRPMKEIIREYKHNEAMR